MRNLKRVLSLALASIMLLGMMVVGASAADKTYADLTDSEKISNKEAVSLLVDLGIIEGKTDGSYDPSATVDRATMAKLITMMLMGDVDQASFQGTKTDLTDIDSSWAEGYIKFCYSNGIITGDGKGHFFPTEPVTVVQAAKMLLVAVGYDATDRGYVGDNWSVNIMRDAQSATEWSRTESADGKTVSYSTGSVRSLTKGISVKASDSLTRDNAAQMIFNTLFVTNKKPVYAFDMGKQYISSYSDVSSLAATTYNGLYQVKGVLESVDPSDKTAVISGKPEKLSAETGDIGSTVAYYRDVNGLVSSAAVATTADVLATSTDGTAFANLVTKGKSGYIGYSMDESVSVYVNGDKKDTVTTLDALKNTLKTTYDVIGTVIEFLDADSNGKYDVVKVTEYTLSTITKTTAEKSDGTEATVSIKGVSKAIDESLVVGDFASLSKDDVVLYAKIGDMYYVYEPETVTGTMTRYNTSKHTMLIDGTTYTAAGIKNATSMTDAQAFTGNDESVFYLDANGYVVAVDGVEGETNYAIIDAIAYVPGSGAKPEGYFEALLVFTDGTSETVNVDKLGGKSIKGTTDTSEGSYDAVNGSTVNVSAARNNALDGIYTYSVNSDGNYELTQVNAVDNANIVKGTATIAGVATANNDTIYVYKTLNSSSKSVFTVYTGYQNAPTSKGANTLIAAATKGGYAKVVFVDATGAGSSVGDKSSNMIVFLANEGVEYIGSTKYYCYKASLNGDVDTYMSKSDLELAKSDYNVLMTIDVDNDKYISNPGAATGANYYPVVASADASAGALKTKGDIHTGDEKLANATLTFDGSEDVYVIGGKDVVEGDAADIVAGTFLWVKTVDETTAAGKVAMKTVYVLNPDDDTPTPAPQTVKANGTALNADKATEVKAAAGETIAIEVSAKSANTYTSVSFDGAGKTNSDGAYVVDKDDVGKTVIVTVVTSEAGKGITSTSYTISVVAELSEAE